MAKQKKIGQVWAACKGYLVKQWPWVVGILVVVVILLLYAGYWVPWTGFGGYPNARGEWQREKTLWDWLDLLVVPLVLAAGAGLFTWVTNKREQEAEQSRIKEQRAVEVDRLREAAFQSYLDRMTEEIKSGLRNSLPGGPGQSIARARTLAVLRQLDGERKGLLVHFLYGSDLLGEEAVVDLHGADLSSANLRISNLSGINLRGVDLSGAELWGANLIRSKLSNAQLRGAKMFGAILAEADLTDAKLGGAYLEGGFLVGACLYRADLNEAILTRADLTDANLGRANLHGAKVTDEQLALAKNLRYATMPDGQRYVGKPPTLSQSEIEPESVPTEPGDDDSKEPPDEPTALNPDGGSLV